MKMNMFHISRWASYAAALLMVAAPAALTSCKEDISYLTCFWSKIFSYCLSIGNISELNCFVMNIV